MQILVTEPLDETELSVIADSYPNLVIKKQFDFPDLPLDQQQKLIQKADCLVVRSQTYVNNDLIPPKSNLKIIVSAATGFNNIKKSVLEKRNIKHRNCPGLNANATAEHVIALMLALSRKIYPAVASMKKKLWIKDELIGQEINNKTIGLIGFGRIGQLVGQKAKSLGLKVDIFDPYIKKTDQIVDTNHQNLGDLLKESDYVSLHVPLSIKTKHLITHQQLSLMKKTAYLINCSRGAIIKEDDLIKILQDRKIAGAALDVFDDEPNYNVKLTTLPNVITTPHIGGQTQEALKHITQQAIEHCIELAYEQ